MSAKADTDALVALEAEVAKLRAEVARLKAHPLVEPAFIKAYVKARDTAARLRAENEARAASHGGLARSGGASGQYHTPREVPDAVKAHLAAAIEIAEIVAKGTNQ